MFLPVALWPQVFEVSEAREGVVVQEMLRSGDYVLPLRQGEHIPSKPPLFHWFGSVAAKSFAAYGEFELRLPSLIAAVLLLMAAANFARVAADTGTGYLAAIILATCSGYSAMAGDGRVDMVFICFASLCILVWLAELRRLYVLRRPIWDFSKGSAMLAALCSGCAIMAKGPGGIVFPLAVLLPIAIRFFGWRGILGLIRIEWVWAFAIAAPWYCSAAYFGGRAFIERLWFENFSRFSGGAGIVEKPTWFYIEHLFTELAPWIFLVLLYAAPKRKVPDAAPGEAQQRSRKFLAQSGWLWFLAVLLVLTASAGKRRAYLVLGAPGLALALAAMLAPQLAELAGKPGFKRVLNLMLKIYASAVLAFLAALTTLIVPLLHDAATRALQDSTSAVVYKSLSVVTAAMNPLLLNALLILLLLPLLLAVFNRTRQSPRMNLIVCGLLLSAGVIAGRGLGFAVKAENHSYRDFARQAALAVPEDAELIFLKPLADESFDGFFFYFARPVAIAPLGTQPAPGVYYLTRRKWLDNMQVSAEQSREILAGGRRIDTAENRLVLFKLS